MWHVTTGKSTLFILMIKHSSYEYVIMLGYLYVNKSRIFKTIYYFLSIKLVSGLDGNIKETTLKSSNF